MISSRNLIDLHPSLFIQAAKFKERVEQELDGVQVIFSCTFRDDEMQQKLYDSGRVYPGPKLTNAKPGESKHNYRNGEGEPESRAFDVFLTRYGKSVFLEKDGDQVSDPIWQHVGMIGKDLGLVWGGDFKSFPEGPHFELAEVK